MATTAVKEFAGALSGQSCEGGAHPVCLRMPHAPDPAGFARMGTAELRACFLVQRIFVAGQVRICCSEIDRAMVGGAVPSPDPLLLERTGNPAPGLFAGGREFGIVNLGGSGTVRVGETAYRLERRDALYVGRGDAPIRFDGVGDCSPPLFYMVGYPASVSHPAALVRSAEAETASAGSAAGANRRAIRKYIRPGAVETCQLTLGITDLEEGSIWNTMPAHRHPRRSEIYFYFDLPEDAIVLHCLGEPQETRHVIVRNGEAVLCPSWSIHSGAGTARYSFVWAMGGENREFSDMDAVAMGALA